MRDFSPIRWTHGAETLEGGSQSRNRMTIRTLLLSVALLTVVAIAGAVTVSASDAPKVSSVTITSDPAEGVGLTTPFMKGRFTYDSRSIPESQDAYAAGDTIRVTVSFDKPVVVTGNPTLVLTVGSANRTATLASASQGDVVFQYPVAVGDSDQDGLAVPANALSLNGGSIQGQDASSAVITHAGLAAQVNHKVDGIAPSLVSVSLVPSTAGRDGVYSIGQEIGVHLRFTEEVYASAAGPPQLRLQVGDDVRWAYSASFPWGHRARYEIQEGDLDLDGVSIGANAIDLNGGTIQDAAGNLAVSLSHPSVADHREFVVDGVRPTVEDLSITSQPAGDGGYDTGEVVRVTVTFSEDMHIPVRRLQRSDGGNDRLVPHLALKIGDATRRAPFESVSGADAVFAYTVQYGDRDSDGVSVEANALSLDSGNPSGPGVIRDATGSMGANDAYLDHDALPNDAGHKVDGSSRVLTLSGETWSAYEENDTVSVATYRVSDSEATISWSLSGDDSDDVSISNGGVLSFVSPPNYEAPADADTDNQYRVIIRASDGASTGTLHVIVVVYNVGYDTDEVPVIVGTARVGQTLTANTSRITDFVDSRKPRYRWFRSDGTTDTEVADWQASYTLTSDDVGKTVKLSVGFWANVVGGREYLTRTSEPTATVAVGGL